MSIIDAFNKNNRKRKRHAYKHNVLCFKKSSSEYAIELTSMRISILNISYSGVGIIANQKLEVGDILIFNLSNKGETKELNFEVRWCYYHNQEYKAGLMFVNITKEDIYFIDQIIKDIY
jgi:hypothetical protein